MKFIFRKRRLLGRRGVLLLVILGLLAMFALVAVTFVVLTGQAQRASRVVQRIDQFADWPQKTCHQALLQILRGPNPLNVASTVGAHSLLETLYGTHEWEGSISGVVLGGQIFEFNNPTAHPPFRLTGRVLTMITGPAAGQSTHIVGVSSTGRLQALAFENGFPRDGDWCVINGAAFSGMGFGYNPATGRLDAPDPDTGRPLALLPNALANRNPVGGANTDYTAVDHQHMALAAIVPGEGIIPSFHRPELVRYWIKQAGGANPDLLRRVILRPMPYDHPAFTGSNPRFNPVDGPWDVDNDGDGVPDSVWIDMGLPVRSAPDGRQYKPLVAALILDMDGRLNVNAHGTISQTQAEYYRSTPAAAAEIPPEVAQLGVAFAGGMPEAPLQRGQGYGPPEINLVPLFVEPGNPGNTLLDRYRFLLLGNGRYPGRYAADGGNPRPGVPGRVHPLFHNKFFQYCGNYWGFLTSLAGAPPYRLDNFAWPPDLLGSGAVGLDIAGHPLFMDLNLRLGGLPFPILDNPYQIDLSRNAPRGLESLMASIVDNPFSPAELERILRPFDKDAPTLPSRLYNLTLYVPPGEQVGYSLLVPRRHQVTTDSWSLPLPAPAMPPQLRSALPARRAHHITDLLMARGAPPAVWPQLLPPEVLAGGKLDLNRALGNGRDDNGDGVVDNEAPSEQIALYVSPSATVAVPMDHFNNGRPGQQLEPGRTPPYTPQELQARYLYVLMLLLADLDYLDRQTGSRQQTCRMIAQWAVNVVDFYDRDSIMTRFAYVVNPFTASGWNPNPADQVHVVYGCERPELLLTEAVAWHDRRTEDLDTDPSKKFTKAKDPNAEEPDEDFDQRLRPQGALFFELFNPQSVLAPPQGDLYSGAVGPQGVPRGVQLNQRAPGGAPVWRVIVVRAGGDEEQPDPDDPVQRPDIDRTVYFVDMSAPPAGLAAGPGTFYPDGTIANNVAPILPGRYCVVGPGNPAGGAGISYIGERVDKNLNQTRRIVLTPNSNPQSNQVEVLNNKVIGGADQPPAPVQPAVAVVVNRPRRLNISEPRDGYPENDPMGEPYKEGEGYPTPYDEPLDSEKMRKEDAEDLPAINRTGTTARFRVLHLQRLANPKAEYHPVYNPYRTVDSLSVDLTAFNGVHTPSDYPKSDPLFFETRQRGEAEQRVHGGINNLWVQEPTFKNGAFSPGGGAVPEHHFNEPFEHTLGYLNKPFGPPIGTPSALYRGYPMVPFPWLTWNNRPFVSELELLLVPALPSSKLLARREQSSHVYYSFIKPNVSPNPYDATTPENVPFPHLLNFFFSGPSGASASPQWHRILNYVGVQSRFIGCEVQVDPEAATGGDHRFHPPANKIPRYREPGRINLNTIFSEDVFIGLMNWHDQRLAVPGLWSKFVRSRRGYGTGTRILDVSADAPTFFARPFRSFAGGELGLAGFGSPREIDHTLLRSDPDDPGRPLFRWQSTNPADNTDRNPYFYYRNLMRLANLVTTQSNVYAIWITVGYFEVRPNPNLPGGFELGPELGIDTGEVQRYRAFYIIDRSIPVGFQRGQDLNVENCILLRRFIE